MAVRRHVKSYMASQTAKKSSAFLVFCAIILLGVVWYVYQTYFVRDDRLFHRLPQQYAKNIYPAVHVPTSFIIYPKNNLSRQDKNFITFFVKSSSGHFLRRHAIRHTWGAVQSVDDMKIEVVFLLGSSKDPRVNKLIKSESSCFNDILQTNVIDTFQNLTLKTLSAIKWIFDQKHSISSYYVFTDDDCVINIRNTVAYLQRKNPKLRSMFCGFMFEKNSGVIRGNGKLSVQPVQYPESFYPDFCRGLMVLMTYKMVIDIYMASTITNYQLFPLEDVMVYGILRYKVSLDKKNIYPVINRGRSLVFYPWDDLDTVVPKIRSGRNMRLSYIRHT